VADLEVGVVPEEVVPLVDVDSGRLVGHDLVQEALVLVPAPVRPAGIVVVRPLVSRKAGRGVNWACVEARL